MKNSIFTLLVTAAVLAATPVLAMDPNQEVPAISVKGRPVIDNSATDLKGVVDDLETNGSILAMMSTGKKGLFVYDKHYNLTDLGGAIRDTNFLTWGPVTYNDDRIEFAISLTNPTPKNTTGKLASLVFDRDGIVGDTPPSSPKPSKKSPKHSPVSSPETSDDEGTTAPSKAITMKNPKFLEDWLELGLVKTDPIAVKEGQTLTVTCEFDDATEVTDISFLNSAQNGYYSGGVTVQPGEKKATFTSVVPMGETQAWLLIRNPGFNGTDKLPLGITHKTNLTSLDIEIKD